MGRPRTNYETVSARFGQGILERIRKALLPDETRADFIRTAVDKEIGYREQAMGIADKLTSARAEEGRQRRRKKD